MAILYDKVKGLNAVIDTETGVFIWLSRRWRDDDMLYEIVFPEDPEFYVQFPFAEKYRWREYENTKGEARREESPYILCLGLGDFDNVLYKIGNERLARYGYSRESFQSFFEQAMFLLNTSNGRCLRFEPDYKVEWVEGCITKERKLSWRPSDSPIFAVKTTNTIQ